MDTHRGEPTGAVERILHVPSEGTDPDGGAGPGGDPGTSPGPAGSEARVLATDVRVADGPLARSRGLMFRRSFPAGTALVFPGERVRPRGLHMLCVPFSIDAVWLVEGRVAAVERLRAWWGLARHRADAVVELPAGTADGVAPGDRVVFEARDGDR